MHGSVRITSDVNGNFSDSTGTLCGDNRVGLFVIVRSDSSGENGKDEFVSTIHT